MALESLHGFSRYESKLDDYDDAVGVSEPLNFSVQQTIQLPSFPKVCIF